MTEQLVASRMEWTQGERQTFFAWFRDECIGTVQQQADGRWLARYQGGEATADSLRAAKRKVRVGMIGDKRRAYRVTKRRAC